MPSRPQTINFSRTPGKFDQKQLNRAQSMIIQGMVDHQQRQRQRNDSGGVLKELLECGICLERLSNPRMLPCQHTFCLECLKPYAVTKNAQQGGEVKTAPSGCISFPCPTCGVVFQLNLEQIPKNLHVESLLKLTNSSNNKDLPNEHSYVSVENKCSICHTVTKERENICQHCMQVFCKICWVEHLSELQDSLPSITKQLDESEERLNHKIEHFESCCELMKVRIKDAVVEKHREIDRLEKETLADLEKVKDKGLLSIRDIKVQIDDIKNQIEDRIPSDSKNMVVSTYMKLHEEVSKILDEIDSFGEDRIIFNPNTFHLDQDFAGGYDEGPDNDAIVTMHVTKNPLENPDSLIVHYKLRSFSPKLVWSKCPRAAGIAVSPWDPTKLYIAASDSHSIQIFNKEQNRVQKRLTHEGLLYPYAIAFSQQLEQFFVSDKWKHCVHVFSKTNQYVKSIGSKGSGTGKLRNPDGLAIGSKGELVVSDSGNNRIVIFDPETGEHKRTVGLVGEKSSLNMPTGVATFGNRIIVMDTGNNRIKTFNFEGEELQEFGAFGRNRGQFRLAETVAVDPLGFILVGDGGNARVQVFTPEGQLVRVFGSSHKKNEFEGISGICVTSELEIIITDGRRRCLKIF